MKKVFALFAVAGMLFTASCGNKEANDENQEIEVVIETEEVEATTDTVEIVIEGAEVEDVEVETEN